MPKCSSQGQGFMYTVDSVVQPFVVHTQGNWSTFAGKSSGLVMNAALPS